MSEDRSPLEYALAARYNLVEAIRRIDEPYPSELAEGSLRDAQALVDYLSGVEWGEDE